MSRNTNNTNDITEGAFMDALGGNSKILGWIKESPGLPNITAQAISMWRTRGIPPLYKPLLAYKARVLGVASPRNFLGIDALEGV